MAITTRRINHEINVEKYRLSSDTDSQAIQRAVNLAVAAGAAKKRIILPVDYVLNASIDVKGLNGAVIEGPGPDAQSLRSSVAMGQMFRTTGATSDLNFRGLNFQGTAVDDVTGPRRSRQWGTTGLGTAVALYGDMAPQGRLSSAAAVGDSTLQATHAMGDGAWWIDGEPIVVTGRSGTAAPYTLTLAAPLTASHSSGAFITMPYVVRNVRMEHSRIQNVIFASTPQGAPSLPVLFGGLRGHTEFYDMRVENCYDPGFVFNENVRVNKLSSRNSADNAISVSRGNQRATITEIDAVNPCYWGVWVAGFNDDYGPQNFLVSDVNVKRPGYGAVTADAASKHGIITNVFADHAYQRGPTDALTNSWGCTVYVGGSPSGSLTPNELATDITVSNIHSYRAPRAGVVLQAVSDVVVENVKVRDVGTEFLADGITPVSSTDSNTNCAVIMLNSTTSTDVTVRGVDARDMRTTPLMNYTIRPQTSPTQRFSMYDNYTYGGRNGWDLIDYVYTSPGIKSNANSESWTSNTKHVEGATAGSNAGGGSTRGFDINGAAGVIRPLRWLTGGVERWRMYAGTASESGGNAGSNLFLDSYNDAGAIIHNILNVTRATGDLTLGVLGKALTLRSKLTSAGESVTVTALAQAATASAASNGADDLAGTINVTSQASPAAGDLFTATFVTAFPVGTPHVVLSATNAATAASRPYIKTRSATAFTVACEVAPAASTSLQFDYHVIG